MHAKYKFILEIRVSGSGMLQFSPPYKNFVPKFHFLVVPLLGPAFAVLPCTVGSDPVLPVF